MIIHKKGTAYYLAFPAIDSAAPGSYKSGVSPLDTAYYKDGIGAWTALALVDAATEIGTTGMYEIDLSATEMNHDKLIIKFSASGMADDAFLFDLQTKVVADLNDIAATDIVSAGAITTLTGAVVNVDTVDVCTTNTDMRGTDDAALATVCTELRLAELDAVNLPAVTDGIQTDLSNTTDGLGALKAVIDAMQLDVDAILVDTSTGVSISATTADQIADAILNRDFSAISDTNARTALNALRFLRNKWGVTGTTLTVTKEDDIAAAWTSTVSVDAAADPVTGSDPV